VKRLRRMCLALALTTGLSLATASVSAAAEEAAPEPNTSLSPASVLACPAEGTRFKSPATDGDTVFLVGPKGFLYSIPTAADYLNLWADWRDIATIDRRTCAKTPYPLANAHLAKLPSSAPVYIWDETFSPNCYRKIKDWATFTAKYHFNPAEIQEQGVIYTCGDEHPWT
jgi:hypothetical protein